MFDSTGLKRENVDLKDPEVVFHILDDTKNNNIIFGEQVASARDGMGRSFF